MLYSRFIAVGALAFAFLAHSSGSEAQSRVWGTYYGGESNGDSLNAVVTNGSGFVYVVGKTKSFNGIATPGAFDGVKTSASHAASAFIAKLDTNGKPVWGTYYGDGSTGNAELVAVKLDSGGNIYVAGNVSCPSQGLAKAGAFQSQCNGLSDLYLAKFNQSGQRLWGTYFGGAKDDLVLGLTVTATGVYIVGSTKSTSGIATSPGPDSIFGGVSDGIVAKFSHSGSRLWSRYYGGAGFDRAFDIACRSIAVGQEHCFVTGDTDSATDIATPGAHDVLGEGHEAFVARFNGANGVRLWGTYFGNGDDPTWANSILVDGASNVFFGGYTSSKAGLATPGAFKTSLPGLINNYLAKLNGNGKLLASTYFGEDSLDDAENRLQDMAMDSAGNVYVFGHAWSSVPGTQATVNAFDKTLQGGDAVVTKFSPGLGRIWSTYYGGPNEEAPSDMHEGGITIGRDNHVYVVGDTLSADALSTPGAHKTVLEGGADGFIAEFAQ